MNKPVYFIRRHALQLLVSLFIIAIFLMHSTHKWPIGLLNSLENALYDVRLNLNLAHTLDKRIVIVDVDEKSLKELGRWPWSRDMMARLLEKLFNQYNVRLAGFDMMFPEADENRAFKALQALAEKAPYQDGGLQQALKQLQPRFEYDRLFAEAMDKHPVVLGYVFTHDEQAVTGGKLPPPLFANVAETFASTRLTYIQGNGYAANLPLLQNAAGEAGFINSIPDSDGVTRRVPLLYGYGNSLYDSFALRVARLALGMPEVKPHLSNIAGYPVLEALQLGERFIPLDEHLGMPVRFHGPRGSFPYVSAVDVLQGRLKQPELLRDAIVLVGTTAQGLYDLRATPVGKVYPGVEVHASVISAILDQHFLYSPQYSDGIEFIELLLGGVFFTFALILLSPLWGGVFTFVFLLFMFWLNLGMWRDGVILPLASPVMLVLSLFMFHLFYGYFVESRSKRKALRLFGQYVPPQLVKEMHANPGVSFSMEGESRELTVLFSDVRGFTGISEQLQPRDLSALMNHFLTPMTQIIHQHKGTIDKYMGDAIMAFWGAPLNDEAHARHALDAAMQMLARVEAMQTEFEQRGWPAIHVGIGLNSGPMSVGNMGSEFRMAYTVLGDAVNLASRLEGLTKQYAVPLIVSEYTKALVPDYIFRELDSVRVKGKDDPVVIYEPVGLAGEVDSPVTEEIQRYEEALDYYRHRNWLRAEKLFTELVHTDSRRFIYQMYAQRVCEFQKQAPPPGWDGVFIHETK